MIRGLIFYENVDERAPLGILPSHRPVLVISEKIVGAVVTVIPLRQNDEAESIYHVPIETAGGDNAVAMVDFIRTVPYKSLSRCPKDFLRDEEMDKVERALLTYLGFDWEE